MRIKKSAFLFLLLSLSLSFGTEVVFAADDTVQAPDEHLITTGPVPPPEVIERDAQKVFMPLFEPLQAGEVTLSLVPGYLWRHGCGPTAIGMMAGYYDVLGYDDLIDGDASTQTDDVNQAIASGGVIGNPYPPGFEQHFEDYSMPIDSGGILTDAYITAGRTPHPDNCIADFAGTSKSTLNMRYGWGRSADIYYAITSYINMRNSHYNPVVGYFDDIPDWETLTTEIDNGRPMFFLVDTDGNNNTDHFVTIVGYRETPTLQYACLDTWYYDIRWEQFWEMRAGRPWGIAQAWALQLAPIDPEINLKQGATDIPDGTGSYDFGRVNLGWDKPVTFVIENLAGVKSLVLTGSPFVQLSGANPDDFVVSQQPATPITPEASVTFEITFDPLGEGDCNAVVSIDNNDIDENPYTFSITGIGNVGTTVYVDADAAGGNDGSSWADAHNYLQDGFGAFSGGSSGGDEILVAEGIYRPDQGSGITPGNRAAAFQLLSGVVVKGGYAGSGQPDPNLRDINTYQTVLSGDIGLIADSSDNSYHVVIGSGTDTTAVLDGFTVTDGNADGSFPHQMRGAGLYNSNGSPTLLDCIFADNSAASRGGGVYNELVSSPVIKNCTFIDNSAGYRGGGLYHYQGSPTLTNCLFTGNSASNAGGASAGNQGSLTLTNCTFNDNSAVLYGGGLYSYQADTTLTNCILWFDTAPDGNEIALENSATADVNYSDVQSGFAGAYQGGGSTLNWGTGNINTDPCLVSGPLGDYYLAQTTAGQTGDSPCIDAGSGTAVALEMHGFTTRTDHIRDDGIVDMGYHYPALNPDINGDLHIDLLDYTILAEQWRQAPGVPSADISPYFGNGVVDANDLAVLMHYWLDYL